MLASLQVKTLAKEVAFIFLINLQNFLPHPILAVLDLQSRDLSSKKKKKSIPRSVEKSVRKSCFTMLHLQIGGLEGPAEAPALWQGSGS